MTDASQLAQDDIDEFVIAAHSDLDKVRAMLDAQPALLNASATWNETPLGAAAHTASRDIAEFLLERGAPLDICAAAMLGLRAEVASLLDMEPELIHATGAHEIPLLFHAAIGGDLAMVRMLVERGADVNVGLEQNTALHGAAGFGHTDIVRYLLDQGADFMATDFQGRTPLDVAESTGHQAVAALLREHMEQA